MLASLFQEIMDQALSAADPMQCLESHLPKDRTGKIHVVGAGKASAKMAASLEKHWQGDIDGLVITRYGHGFPTKKIKVIEAAHPVPDEAGQKAAQEIFEKASSLGENDHLFVLMSGGGSALMSHPIDGVSLEDKQMINKALLQSGANIHEMNCVRKHLSKIKGGGLARATYPARVTTFAISDVAGDDPSVIASGPTVSDPTTEKQARDILTKYKIEYKGPMQETAKAGETCFEQTEYKMIATPQMALERAAAFIKEKGYVCEIVGDALEGDVRELAELHLQAVSKLPRPCFVLSGGEATVKLDNFDGCGGPNGEFILHLLNQSNGKKGLHALAIDTDGIDGSEDNAGAWFDPDTYQIATDQGFSIEEALKSHRSYDFFKMLDRLIMTGPTHTNINDFRMIFVE